MVVVKMMCWLKELFRFMIYERLRDNIDYVGCIVSQMEYIVGVIVFFIDSVDIIVIDEM